MQSDSGIRIALLLILAWTIAGGTSICSAMDEDEPARQQEERQEKPARVEVYHRAAETSSTSTNKEAKAPQTVPEDGRGEGQRTKFSTMCQGYENQGSTVLTFDEEGRVQLGKGGAR